MGKFAGYKDKRPFLRKGSANGLYFGHNTERVSKEDEFSGEEAFLGGSRAN